MPATTVKTLIYEIKWDDGDAQKKADAWDRGLKDNAKNFEKLIKEVGAGRAVFLKFTEGADVAWQKLKAFGQYLVDFTNPAIAAWRSAQAVWTVFTSALSAGWSIVTSAFNAGISVIKSMASALIDFGKRGVEIFTSFSIEAVKNFAQYEDTLSHARRVMGLTREETLQLGDSLIQLSTSFAENGLQAGISSDELAKIAGQLGQLGYSARDNVDGFNELVATVAKVSVAFGMSSSKAAESLGILQNLYGFTQDQFSNVASSIAYLGNTTVATSGQILDIMTRVGGIAGILGVSAQEMAGISATLREAGVSAQVGGTAMSQIFSKLSSDVDKFGEVLGEGGLSGEMLRFKIESGNATGALSDVLRAIQTINNTQGKIAAIQALNDLGLQGVRVQQTLLALSNNIGGLNTNLAASEQAFQENTAVNDSYAAAIDNTQQKMTQFKNILDAIQKIVGKDMALAFSTFLEQHLIPFADHFKTWLETSAGADRIFGQNGLIANGLENIGQLLSGSEDVFFGWLDNLDALVGDWIAKVQEDFKAWATENGMSIQEIQQKLNEFFNEFGRVIDFLHGTSEAAKEVFYYIQGTLAFLEQLGKPIGKVAEVILDIANGTSALTATMDGYTEGIKQGEQAMKDFGVTAVYRSVLPDIGAATVDITGKMIDYGDNIITTGGHMKNLYKTTEGAWTNINREIQDGATVWRLSDENVVRGQKDVQFNLYQTAEAVSVIPGLYKQIAKEAGTAAQVMMTTADLTVKFSTLAEDFVKTSMSGNDAAMKAIAQAGGLKPQDIQTLKKSPGMLSASGLIAASQQLRADQGIGGSNITQNLPTTPQQPQVLQATLVVGKQEIGNLSAVLSDQKKQEQRRGFGGA